MSKPDDWMPWYVADYLADTTHLTTEQHGAYCLLLMAAWKRAGRLPADEDQLAQIARMDAKRWAAHRGVLLAFFTRDGETYRQERLSREYEKAVERGRARSAFWRSLPGPVRTAIQARRRAAKLNATPKWLNKGHRAAIQAVYDEAARLTQETGIAHEVDHVVPLVGREVCGLHVPWNLEPIPASLNRAKGNLS